MGSWSTKTHLNRKGKAACAARTYREYLVFVAPECLRCRVIENRTRCSRSRVMELEAEIAKLRMIGGQMANLCFNLRQRPDEPIGSRNAEVMNELFQGWDAIERTTKVVKQKREITA